MEDLVNNFFKFEEELCKAFGYTHDWRIFPIVDERENYWGLTEGEKKVCHSPLANNVGGEIDGNQCYSASVYTYRHLSKWVYRTEKYTMILMDTHCDGNIYLGIFDSSKEVKEFTDMYSDL